MVFLSLLVVVAWSTAATAQEDPACDGPQDFEGHTLGDGIILNWTADPEADAYNIYRAAGEDERTLDATIDGRFVGFMDNEVEAGTTYTYELTAIVAENETEACGTIEVTAVPVLPTFFAGIAAAALGIGAYVLVRRP